MNIRLLYNRWLGAKGRYEMAKAMNTDSSHKNTFKKSYSALTKELHDALMANGYKTRAELEKALAELEPKKPSLTLIRGGKQ